VPLGEPFRWVHLLGFAHVVAGCAFAVAGAFACKFIMLVPFRRGALLCLAVYAAAGEGYTLEIPSASWVATRRLHGEHEHTYFADRGDDCRLRIRCECRSRAARMSGQESSSRAAFVSFSTSTRSL